MDYCNAPLQQVHNKLDNDNNMSSWWCFIS